MAGEVLFAGCASNDGGKPNPAANREIGMTKDQIVALYGPTNHRRVASEGETWVYNLSTGDAFIPWTSGYRPRLRIVIFDQDGKVKSCSYSH
jgi:hypothetical protein